MVEIELILHSCTHSSSYTGIFDECSLYMLNSHTLLLHLLCSSWVLITNMDNEERQSPPPSDENTKTSCKCKRSMCLKLYCECFSRNLMCGEDCGCTGCHNTPNHERERQKTIDQCLSRDPNAFYRAKIQPIASIPLPATGLDEDDGQDNSSGIITMRGCNCRKTGCMKRYCECFNAGVKCTEASLCGGCKNGNASHMA